MKIKRLLASVGALAIAATGMALTAPAATAAPTSPLPLEISNKSGKSDPLFIYILGKNQSNQIGWIDSSGSFHVLSGGTGTPAPAGDISIAGPANGHSITVSSPILESGRIYYSYGQKLTFSKVLDGNGVTNFAYPSIFNAADPNLNILHGSAEYSFVRHPDQNTGLWFNSSQVDFVGPPVQVGVEREDGTSFSIGRLKDNGLQNIINYLQSQPGWGGLVKQNGGQYLRILSAKDGVIDGALATGPIQNYINAVWSKYQSTDLTIRSRTDDQNFKYTGRVQGNNFVFQPSGTASGSPVVTISKPTPQNVVSCDGSLTGGGVQGEIARTVCAAFNRSNILSQTQQPALPRTYFTDAEWTNHYVKIVHDQMVSGRSYAFAYDDVSEQESLVATTNPKKAFLQLDPFTGAATPLKTEEGVTNPGGGDTGGGTNPGGGDTGGGTNPGGGDTGGGDTGGGGTGGGGTGGGDTGGGDTGGGDTGGGDTGGGDNPGGSGNGGTHTDTGVGTDGKTNPQGTVTIGTTLAAAINVANAPKQQGGWFRDSVLLSVSAEAPASTRPVVQIRVNSGKWQTYTGRILVVANGKTTVRARVVAGKATSPSDTRTLKVDRKAPTKLKAKVKKVRGKTVIKLSAKDAESKIARIQYRINGKGKWKTYKSAGIKVKAKIKKVTFRAIDKAGNKSHDRTTGRTSGKRQWSPAR